MLTFKLEESWNKATEQARVDATAKSKELLSNLVHYPIERKRYYTDDVQRLAAELIDWRM